MKKLIAFFAVFLFLIQPFTYFNKASASGLSIDAEITGPSSLRIEDGHSVTTNLSIDLIPGGTATVKRKPIDVVVLFDKSATMAGSASDGKTMLKQAQEAVQEGVNLFFENTKDEYRDRFGLVSFDTRMNSLYTMNSLHFNPLVVSNRTDQATAEGGKNYTDGLREARRMLETARNNGQIEEDRQQYIILFSDGNPMQSSVPESVSGAYQQLIPRDTYLKMYSYTALMEKWMSGQYIYFDKDYYIISDSKQSLDGTYTVHYDATPVGNDPKNIKQNNIVIENDNGLYLHSRNNKDVPVKINDQIHEEVQKLAKNKITLLSLVVGNNSDGLSYLTDLSKLTNGIARKATKTETISMIEGISVNRSSQYDLLSNGYLSSSLPAGATVEKNDKISLSGSNMTMNLNNIIYNPNPPNKGHSSLHYDLPLTFTAPGKYKLLFDISYNSGSVVKRGLAYEVNVILPLREIRFKQRQKVIKVGESIRLKDYLTFIPYNATNQMIREVKTSNPSLPVQMEKINGEWFIKPNSIGITEIQAIADEDPAIKDSMELVVKKNKTNGYNGNFKW